MGKGGGGGRFEHPRLAEVVWGLLLLLLRSFDHALDPESGSVDEVGGCVGSECNTDNWACAVAMASSLICEMFISNSGSSALFVNIFFFFNISESLRFFSRWLQNSDMIKLRLSCSKGMNCHTAHSKLT